MPDPEVNQSASTIHIMTETTKKQDDEKVYESKKVVWMAYRRWLTSIS